MRGQPQEFIRGHNRRAPEPYRVDAETGCWIWQLHRDRHGYGRMTVDGRPGRIAHRVYFERQHGPIPAGQPLDHTCGNPACVNPDHLELVSQAENVRRGRHTKLTMEEVEKIRRSSLGPRELSHRFPVDESTISHIRAGRIW